MNMLVEYTVIVFLYMFTLTFFMKKIGGRELVEVEREVKKYLEMARKGKEEAFEKLNKLNAKRMKMSMKAQMYLFPFIILFIYFLKKRYASLTLQVFGFRIGWFGLFILLGIPYTMIAEKIVKKMLGYE